MVANAGAVAQQAQASAADRAAGTIADAAEASRRATQSAMDYTHSLSLRFASEEDERAYREREAERVAYIAAQQAKHTPEGDLNASGATVGQMVDARAHGASGPEFDKHWNELVASTERLRAAAKANGVSTEEFNRRLADDIRRILREKGLTEAQIDAQFKAHGGDPLETAKAYVQNGDDFSKLERVAQRAERVEPSARDSAKDLTALIASLQSSGLVTAPHDPATQPDHGVAVTASSNGVRSV